ncbi:hypothetical protein GCM10027442_03380 [Emticicia fontis]
MVRPFTQAYYLIDYQLRKDFIAKALCVNKQKPQLNCNGKCYLSKRLKAAEEHENKAQHNIFDKYEIPTMICEEVANLYFQSRNFAYTPALDTYSNLYSGLFDLHIFHPPCQA